MDGTPTTHYARHGISFIPVDNSALQQAITLNKSHDIISNLKAQVSWNAVYGFSYSKQSFSALANILSGDYGFTPFRYKSALEGAIYDTTKHPHAYGLIRGKSNLFPDISWVCLDIDTTSLTDQEMHKVLHTTNHHIARTSNPDNAYKYRIFIELSRSVQVSEELWKPFIRAIGNQFGLKVDSLGRSQVYYSYANRNVYSTIDKMPLDPSMYLKIAQMQAAAIEDKRQAIISSGSAVSQLASPMQTFNFAYESPPGVGTNRLLGAISLAKELGASKDYITDLVYSINNFWDHSMPLSRLQSTVLTAI